MQKTVFNSLVENVSNKLFRYILSQGVKHDDADDIMQNCFEAVWKSKVEEEREAEKYLFGTAYKQCAEYWRQKHKTKNIEFETEQIVNFDSNLSKTVMHRALNILNQQQKSLIMLKDVEGYSYEEIAEITMLNISQVKVYLHRARLSLKNFIVKLENVV